jgi:hypothetical protein
MKSKFRNFLFKKKVKSPLSMNFGRISTSKCRGKLQKMGVLYTHSPQKPWPIPKLPKIHFLKIKKFQKNWDSRIGPGVNPRSPTGRGLTPGPVRLFPFFLNFFSFLPPLFAQVVNSFSLATAHARPAQTSP